jgi:hypothetical protein
MANLNSKQVSNLLATIRNEDYSRAQREQALNTLENLINAKVNEAEHKLTASLNNFEERWQQYTLANPSLFDVSVDEDQVDELMQKTKSELEDEALAQRISALGKPLPSDLSQQQKAHFVEEEDESAQVNEILAQIQDEIRLERLAEKMMPGANKNGEKRKAMAHSSKSMTSQENFSLEDQLVEPSYPQVLSNEFSAEDSGFFSFIRQVLEDVVNHITRALANLVGVNEEKSEATLSGNKNNGSSFQATHDNLQTRHENAEKIRQTQGDIKKIIQDFKSRQEERKQALEEKLDSKAGEKSFHPKP